MHNRYSLKQLSPTSLVPRTGFMEDNFSRDQGGGWGGGWFGLIQTHYTYCALYFYCYYTVIFNEIIIQLTTMQNPRSGSPELVFLSLGGNASNGN